MKAIEGNDKKLLNNSIEIEEVYSKFKEHVLDKTYNFYFKYVAEVQRQGIEEMRNDLLDSDYESLDEFILSEGSFYGCAESDDIDIDLAKCESNFKYILDSIDEFNIYIKLPEDSKSILENIKNSYLSEVINNIKNNKVKDILYNLFVNEYLNYITSYSGAFDNSAFVRYEKSYNNAFNEIDNLLSDEIDE